MSSLKDIMDVDVEPLQSQAYRKAKEAEEVASGPSVNQSAHGTSSPDNQDEASTKRRRQNRGPKSTFNAVPSRSSGIQHTNSVGEPMSFQAPFRGGSSEQASTPGSTHQSSPQGPESTDVPVKYTRVTHRISKAKKGVRIHTCEICTKTFTRAEHLRRHQLSHKEPTFPCTFQGCDKVFHRPDLLARHVQRHDIQDDQTDNSPAAHESPATSGSDPSVSPTQFLHSGAAAQVGASSSRDHKSVVDQAASSSSAGIEGSSGLFSTSTGTFQQDLSDSGPSTFPSTPNSTMPAQDFFPQHSQRNLSRLSDFAASQSLTAHIREEPQMPGLSSTKESSPLYSSESDSNYSTQSETSRPSQWARNERPASTDEVPDWMSSSQIHLDGILDSTQELRNTQFDPLLQFESYPSPRMTAPTSIPQTLLTGPSFDVYGGESLGVSPLPTMYSKTMAPGFLESTPRSADFGMAGVELKIKPLMEQQLETLRISATMEHLLPLHEYITTYWQTFHTGCPIIHRDTFDPMENIILSSAMAAIGTQYHNTAAAREKGAELNDYCRTNIGLLLNWDLHAMQAIVLTEIFTRYRGRKSNVKLSRQFDETYNRLIRSSIQDQAVSDAHELYAPPGTMLHHDSETRIAQQHSHPSDIQSEWVRWIDLETRQRLLALCFVYDAHQSVYHEQNRSTAHYPEITSLLYLPCPESIWNASSALDWQAQVRGYIAQPFQLFEPDLKTIASQSPFMHWLAISSLVSKLPPRNDSKYPNQIHTGYIPLAVGRLEEEFPTSVTAHSCLALYSTPVHDLLAVAGDTWVFGKKLTPPSAFHSAQTRLKTWASSLNAATATLHACRIISSLLTQQNPPAPCLSNYWAYYTAALICWTFGSRHHPSLSSSSSSTSSSSASQPRSKARKYISAVLAFSAEELLTNKTHVREDVAGVIDVVREHLVIDAVGSKCMMLVDAVHVLTQLTEPGRARWWLR